MQRNYNFKFDFEPYFECYRILNDDSRNALVELMYPLVEEKIITA